MLWKIILFLSIESGKRPWFQESTTKISFTFLFESDIIDVGDDILSKKDKPIERLMSRPTDFKFDELIALLGQFGYKILSAEKTSGSRVAFTNGESDYIRLHKPHPKNVLKQWSVYYRGFNRKGLLTNDSNHVYHIQTSHLKKFDPILRTSNAYKSKGMPVVQVILYWVQLVFTKKSMYMNILNGTNSAGFAKDVVYRLPNAIFINWTTFLLQLAASIVMKVKSLTGGDRLNALILDDTLFERPGSRKWNCSQMFMIMWPKGRTHTNADFGY